MKAGWGKSNEGTASSGGSASAEKSECAPTRPCSRHGAQTEETLALAAHFSQSKNYSLEGAVAALRAAVSVRRR